VIELIAVFVKTPALSAQLQKQMKINIGYVNELRIFRAEKSAVKCSIYEHSYIIMVTKT
jgi:hypothetical protein